MLILMVMAPVSAWDRPGGNPEGCCFSLACANNRPLEGCEFNAQVQDQSWNSWNREWGNYSAYPHAYLFQNAIRIFHEEGGDNWAEYLAQEDHFQQLADGASWADEYKGGWYIELYMNFFFGLVQIPLDRWRANSYAGFDHCYSKFSSNPYGAGLEDVHEGVIANSYLAYVEMAISFALVYGALALLSLIPGVGMFFGGLMGLLLLTGSGSLSLGFSPSLLLSYPSAARLAEEHYNRAIDINRYTDPANRYWPDRSPEENSLFELGWAAHFAQDMGVIYHLRDIWSNMMGPHNAYEAHAVG